jgi:hypothetical protein
MAEEKENGDRFLLQIPHAIVVLCTDLLLLLLQQICDL